MQVQKVWIVPTLVGVFATGILGGGGMVVRHEKMLVTHEQIVTLIANRPGKVDEARLRQMVPELCLYREDRSWIQLSLTDTKGALREIENRVGEIVVQQAVQTAILKELKEHLNN